MCVHHRNFYHCNVLVFINFMENIKATLFFHFGLGQISKKTIQQNVYRIIDLLTKYFVHRRPRGGLLDSLTICIGDARSSTDRISENNEIGNTTTNLLFQVFFWNSAVLLQNRNRSATSEKLGRPLWMFSLSSALLSNSLNGKQRTWCSSFQSSQNAFSKQYHQLTNW